MNYELAVLAEEYEAARLRFEAHQMRNVYGLDAIEAARVRVAYHAADAEMRRARSRLESAKDAFASS
jgi:hypothetical protein